MANYKLAHYVVERNGDEYLVCAVCDTLIDARHAVRELEASDVRNGIYEPFRYIISEVYEDCGGIELPVQILGKGGVQP